MKPKSSIFTSAAVSFLFVTAWAGPASAHDKRDFLTKKATAIDVYQVTCDNDGGGVPRLEVAIIDLAPVMPPVLMVEVEKGPLKKNARDPIDGDRRYSAPITIEGGAGNYRVTVSKLPKPGKRASSQAFKELYKLQYHCKTGVEHTGTDLIHLKNQ